MSHRTVSLGRIMGIPIGLDYSWFLIFILLTWSFAVGYFPAEFPHWPVAVYWVTGAATAILLFVSVLLHELGHSAVALRYKIPINSITLFLFGGVAAIATEPPSASAEFWIAIAGPVTSFCLAGLLYLLTPAAALFEPAFGVIKYLAFINLMLVAFNLIPGFPLDGGRVFRAIVWGITRNMRRATVIAANVGRFFAFLFIVVGVWQLFSGNIGDGLWIAFIGWFLESAASAQIHQQVLQSLLSGHRVSDAMSRTFTEIDADIPLQRLVDEHILANARRAFVVRHGDQVAGFLTLHALRHVPREQWPTTLVGQVMIPAGQMKRTQPDAELWECFSSMNRDGVNQLPVMTDGQIHGILSREDVIGYLHTLRDFGG
jgi:Zn-dependent protease